MGRVYGGVLDVVTLIDLILIRKTIVEADDLTFKDINQLKSPYY